jgi:hypothetical protein
MERDPNKLARVCCVVNVVDLLAKSQVYFLSQELFFHDMCSCAFICLVLLVDGFLYPDFSFCLLGFPLFTRVPCLKTFPVITHSYWLQDDASNHLNTILFLNGFR